MSKQTKTPQLTPCRRLGLCRSIQKKTPLNDISRNIAASPMPQTPCSLLKEKLQITPNTNMSPITPVLDKKASKSSADELQTPTAVQQLKTPIIPKSSLSSTSNKLKYRLSLNKNIRDKITKKRLNFVAVTSTASTTNSEMSTESLKTEAADDRFVSATSSTPAMAMEITDELLTDWPDDITDTELLSIQIPQPAANAANLIGDLTQTTIEQQCAELERELERKRTEIVRFEKHQQEVGKLQSVIAIWENGFRQALRELQANLMPPQDTTTILRHLNIELDLANLVD